MYSSVQTYVFEMGKNLLTLNIRRRHYVSYSTISNELQQPYNIIFISSFYSDFILFFCFFKENIGKNMKMPNIEAISPPIVPAANGNQKASFP